MHDRAERLDASDPLAPFRSRFHLPDGSVYLDGNSLGAIPATATDAISEVLGTWQRRAVLGWDEWIDAGAELGDRLAPIIGAPPGAVAVGDQTSVNLYKLADAALTSTGRSSILTDAGNFPSDRYVLASVAERHGGELVVIPADPEADDARASLNDAVGLVAMSHVSYRSGHMHDGGAWTRLAHEHGAMMLWDLAHSAGAVPVHLDAWGADLAVGCTYKYLNGGPGSPGYLFVRPDLHDRMDQPIHGWFGHRDMFAFADEYEADPSIRRYLVGTPSIIALAATRAGIDVVADAGVAAIRDKGIALSELFLEAIDRIDDGDLTVVSPRRSSARGSHIALAHPDALAISRALRADGVIVDFRAPDILRFGFAPLYLRFADTITAAEALERVLLTNAHGRHGTRRHGVT